MARHECVRACVRACVHEREHGCARERARERACAAHTPACVAGRARTTHERLGGGIVILEQLSAQMLTVESIRTIAKGYIQNLGKTSGKRE
eukprot:483081-Pleurochrysis_carterae.AAC.2